MERPTPRSPSRIRKPTLLSVEQLSLKGVANVYRHSDKILSDGQPDSENGLAELKKIGVQTIISEVSFSRKQLINQARH